MYEREAFLLAEEKNIDDISKEPSSQEALLGVWKKFQRYETVIGRLVKAGAFATGILIVSTQLDLLLEFKRYVQVGESEETDLRLLVAIIEVINDVFFEALVIGSWRIIHAGFMSNPDNRWKRF